ncbi:MAG TPA: hypothetical protein VIY73_18105 [Polyangiaceae bacterium]
MSGERFDSGAVLSRATPVLTFSTLGAVDESSSDPLRSRANARMPTLAPVWTERVDPAARRNPSLPVIPRIVRRTLIVDSALVAPLARAAGVARRAGLGTLLFAALGLATLGAIAGLGMRSLSDEFAVSSAVDLAAPPHAYDATGVEHLLARTLPADRSEHGPAWGGYSAAGSLPPVPAPTPALALAPSPAHTPAPAHPPARASSLHAHAPAPPAHTAFAASHAAARKHASPPALARR